ncbi:S-type pyocin domain-containing protein [Citrobacter sp. Cpo030]|uniref:S-type pyocin domain-containing protein n=1 Tax=Citrobacter TaxID=544 RepID=UPI001ECDD35C|nr:MULTISPECIES: S-type pyocin domain-containing protein [Citrobacter]EGT0021149.1 S-type Pyocin [Citrobacter freundii]EGT0456775.1 S-type Pyocin [Citrobacter freundii]MDM2839837.1 S-type pyocin domain-containing protein [Citrobacter sp. Cpo086]MDM2895757.1 S-type pyocin domain-containing protein [Citrobacter sp. Cpo030]MDN4402575.1 S-type pyocin domain-containing protein [Citrobacter portucalensis]
MAQILGTGEGKTSSAAKEPVVERMPAQVFFESMALANSAAGTYIELSQAAPATGTMGEVSGTLGRAVGQAVTRVGVETVATVGRRFALGALFYSKGLNAGETEMLQSIRGDQLYHNLIHGQILIGAYTRENLTVTREEYLSEYTLRSIAEQNGKARTRVRFRIEEDPATGKMISRSYEVGEKSGLDRVRVRFAEQINDDLWQFEDALSGVTLLWSRSAGQGRFEWGASPTTVHDGKTGGYSTPPTPVPDSRGIWGLPNPAPEPLPPVPGTPIPEEQKPNIETFPIEDRDFNDFIIVDPKGVVPAIYVYFQKASVGDLEVDYYGNFEGRSRQGLEVDHIPSKEAVRIYLKGRYPHLDNDTIEQMTDRVAAVAIPAEVHRQCSETYGGRNNSKFKTEDGELIPQKVLDASNLRAAVDFNWDVNAECLKDYYNVSNEKLEQIRARLHELNQDAGLY